MDELAKLIEFRQGKPYWLVRLTNKIDIAKPAGAVNSDGHRTIGYKYKQYYAHRLHWFQHHGSVPPMLDHINRKPDDNRIENLRPATYMENMQNRTVLKNNKLGVRGVQPDGNGFRGRVMLNGKRHQKYFKTLAEAVAWRKEKERELHPFAPTVIQ